MHPLYIFFYGYRRERYGMSSRRPDHPSKRYCQCPPMVSSPQRAGGGGGERKEIMSNCLLGLHWYKEWESPQPTAGGYWIQWKRCRRCGKVVYRTIQGPFINLNNKTKSEYENKN